MKFIADWYNQKFKKPEPNRLVSLYQNTFNTAPGHELLLFWTDTINMHPPDTLDPQELANWRAQCKFVSDIVQAVDAANNPDRYKQEVKKPVSVIGGSFGGR